MENKDITTCTYRFGALKSDSTLQFFRNSCTKSGSLRFSQLSGCWLILSVYILNEFWLSLCKIVRSSVILLLPLFVYLLQFIIFWLKNLNLKIQSPDSIFFKSHKFEQFKFFASFKQKSKLSKLSILEYIYLVMVLLRG